MRNNALTLQLAHDHQESRGKQGSTIGFEHLRPDDDIGDGVFVFQRDENHATRRARPLAHKHEACHCDSCATFDFQNLRIRCDAARRQARPQKRKRMGLQRHLQCHVVLHDVLAESHRGETHLFFATQGFSIRIFKDRQFRNGDARVFRAAIESLHTPQCLPPVEPERAEAIGLRQSR